MKACMHVNSFACVCVCVVSCIRLCRQADKQHIHQQYVLVLCMSKYMFCNNYYVPLFVCMCVGFFVGSFDERYQSTVPIGDIL